MPFGPNEFFCRSSLGCHWKKIGAPPYCRTGSQLLLSLPKGPFYTWSLQVVLAAHIIMLVEQRLQFPKQEIKRATLHENISQPALVQKYDDRLIDSSVDLSGALAVGAERTAAALLVFHLFLLFSRCSPSVSRLCPRRPINRRSSRRKTASDSTALFPQNSYFKIVHKHEVRFLLFW